VDLNPVGQVAQLLRELATGQVMAQRSQSCDGCRRWKPPSIADALWYPQAEGATEMDPLITVEDALGDLDPRDG